MPIHVDEFNSLLLTVRAYAAKKSFEWFIVGYFIGHQSISLLLNGFTVNVSQPEQRQECQDNGGESQPVKRGKVALAGRDRARWSQDSGVSVDAVFHAVTLSLAP